MGKPRVWEEWECYECHSRYIKKFRSLASFRRKERELHCIPCQRWTRHTYIQDAPNPWKDE